MGHRSGKYLNQRIEEKLERKDRIYIIHMQEYMDLAGVKAAVSAKCTGIRIMDNSRKQWYLTFEVKVEKIVLSHGLKPMT